MDVLNRQPSTSKNRTWANIPTCNDNIVLTKLLAEIWKHRCIAKNMSSQTVIQVLNKPLA